MAFRFDSNESTLRLVSLDSCGLRAWKIEFNLLFKTCELRICIKTEFDTCKLPTPSTCETGFSLNNWLPATQHKCLLYHSNLFNINSSWCIQFENKSILMNNYNCQELRVVIYDCQIRCTVQDEYRMNELLYRVHRTVRQITITKTQ